MRLQYLLEHPLIHSIYSGIGIDNHHDQPENIEAENTSLSVQPLPGGPGIWDIVVPLNANIVLFTFRSQHLVQDTGAMAGVTGIATRTLQHASSVDIGGATAMVDANKAVFYCKPGGALNLSDKIFSSAGTFITLTDAYLYLLNPTTRVLRTYWTNYGASILTLDARGQISVIG
jgi:hypothetical protein